ncbi:MAG: type II toxin-antitoxin system ParD family antitoxin [Planctomycetes bacterium]|nr:type II toxin-antitoxin system ParD family antitoxin [Planctomycetota bacterium]
MMTLQISPDLARLVQQQMATGRYETENDLLFSALSLLAERERKLEEVRRELMPAIESLDRGEGELLDMKQVRARVLDRFNEAK